MELYLQWSSATSLLSCRSPENEFMAAAPPEGLGIAN